MSRSLLRWLDDPSPDHGVRCVDATGVSTLHPYTGLADRARRIAAGLGAAGVPRGGRVAVVPGARDAFVAAFFGVLRAGATASVLAPPLPMQTAAYVEHLTTTLVEFAPTVVIADDSVRALVTDVLGRHLPVPVLTPDELAATDGDGLRAPADLAMVQFTSGTGGRPRGVRIPFAAVEANTHAIRTWLGVDRDDEWASWLPLHHDMGLVGCLLAPVVGGNSVALCLPEDFVREPLNYLRCFGAGPGTLTATPGFGLDRILRRVRPGALDGLDFSGWKAVVVGAERVDPALLDRFDGLLGPHGLAPTALLPAYGLAESTLAVTGTPLGRGRRVSRLSTGTRVVGGPAVGTGERVLSCGTPVGDATVTVVDDAGLPLPDGHLGEVRVCSSSIAAGYVGVEREDDLVGGVLNTGDAGFVVDGELYVIGRLGDSVKVRGCSVFAEDVEAALAKTGLPAHRLAVVLGERAGRAVAVAVLEAPGPDEVGVAATVLGPSCGGAEPVLVSVPIGTIPRTPSGKRRRRALWRAFTAGQLDHHMLHDQEGQARDGE